MSVNNNEFQMPLNLQWFAKDGEGGEKTEQPTAKRLSDARNDGKVAKSKELDNAVGLLLLFILLQVTMSNLGGGMLGLFDTFYNRIPEFLGESSREVSTVFVSKIVRQALMDAFGMVMPFFAAGCIVIRSYRKCPSGKMEGYDKAIKSRF